ncbi:MAG: hypothetical protein MJA30_10850, partial [Cytophagales bacterium]|nr:hypothetical protein [Cytophagales bacterium]
MAPGPIDIGIGSLPGDTQSMRRYTQQYEYDELGNIMKMIHLASGGNWTRNYHYDFTQNNYLLSNSQDGTVPSSPQYQYDNHGNLTQMPHLDTMLWDFADRLQQVDLGGGGKVYYTYDASGERVRKVIERNGGLKEERLYLGGWEVYRKSQSGTLQLERETLHITDDKNRIALVETLTVDNGTALSSPVELIRYQLDNHVGSAALELDNAAAVISYEEYHAFGTSSYRAGRTELEVSLKRYRYVGKERDEETGLFYYGARYYSAWLGRFLNVDPLKDDYPQLTPFNYAGNKPITHIDIGGLQSTGDKKRNEDSFVERKFSTGASLVDESGTKLNAVSTTGVQIGESITQTQLTTTAEVIGEGRIRVNQIRQDVASRGDLVFAFETSSTAFEGTLSQAQEAFPGVDFSELNAGNAPEFVEIEGIPRRIVEPGPFIETKVLDSFDAETEGGPISWDEYLNRTQNVLDVVGLIPGFGEVADIANGIISLARGNWLDAGLSFASAIPGFGYVASATKGLRKASGVYDLTTTGGQYVGQSVDMAKRIKRHFGSGKLKQFSKVDEVLHEMKGSTKFEREIYEQYLILRKGGTDNLINKVNPVGGRFDLKSPEGLKKFYDEANKVIKKF